MLGYTWSEAFFNYKKANQNKNKQEYSTYCLYNLGYIIYLRKYIHILLHP